MNPNNIMITNHNYRRNRNYNSTTNQSNTMSYQNNMNNRRYNNSYVPFFLFFLKFE